MQQNKKGSNISYAFADNCYNATMVREQRTEVTEEELCTLQEGADTRVVLHVPHTAKYDAEVPYDVLNHHQTRNVLSFY